jgi:hypothetical protein
MRYAQKHGLVRCTAVAGASVALLLVGLASFSVPAFALPEGRVYEMVSPPYKGGYGVGQIEAVAPSGEAVAYGSQGAFAGVPTGLTAFTAGYLARRGPSGWSTSPLAPPAAIAPNSQGHDYSATLESTIVLTNPAASWEAARGSREAIVFQHSTDAADTVANWTRVGPVLKDFEASADDLGSVSQYLGASSDLSHVVLELPKLELPSAPEEEEAGELQIYDLADSQSSPQRITVDDEGELINSHCLGELGGSGRERQFNSIAAGGEELFFTLNTGARSEGECGETGQLFVRLGGSRTLEVSRPLDASCPEGSGVPCSGSATRAPANFVGANEAGTEVFFETTSPLTGDDQDQTDNLYMARIGCPEGEAECGVADREVTSLVQVSPDPVASQAAEVQGMVRVSPDGSYVYFVAHGVLTGEPGPEGQVAVDGADNLYVYDAVSGKVAFIADLCSNAEASGTQKDPRCPSGLGAQYGGRNDSELWLAGAEAGTTPDGGFLVFSSYGQLVANDTDSARDVYRYDAETGGLVRVSVGEGGYDANGNGNDSTESDADATIRSREQIYSELVYVQHEMSTLSISEDGSRIVFETAEPLSPAAVNGLENVYEWHQGPGQREGRVSLVSSGSGGVPVEEAVISPSGRDIFFTTSQSLAPQDTDGQKDIYDARLEEPGEAFPPSAAEREPCEGDACQGPLTNPAPLLVPGSVSQAPGGNYQAPVVAGAVPGKTAIPKKKAQKCARGEKPSRGKCVKTRPKGRAKVKSTGNNRRGKS